MNKTKILIVEDEIVIADLLRSILHMRGYQVTDIVTSGADAVASVTADPPDMILMDIKLTGDRDGIETAREIYGQLSIPSIYITAHADDETIRRAAATASYGYIIKPFKEDVIYATIEMAVSKYRLEKELMARNEELQNLTAHMESIREEERKNISREIHDRLGQSLTALRIDCSWLQNHLDDPGGREQNSAKTAGMVRLIDETLDDVRNICAELRPGILDHLGLVAAIRWQSGEINKRSGIAFNQSFCSEDLDIAGDIAITIFRIYQEITTNIVRHSGATEVWVSIVKSDGGHVMTVRDNGAGITPEQAGGPASFGLIGMRERARLCGGTLTISGEPGRGTVVALTVPV